MSREISPIQTPVDDPARQIMDSYHDFVRVGAKNILNRSVLDGSGEVVWMENEDEEQSPPKTEIQNAPQPTTFSKD